MGVGKGGVRDKKVARGWGWRLGGEKEKDSSH